MDLIKPILKHLTKERRGRFRSRRGHYASNALTCLREQYWSMTGVPETNPTDFIGRIKMLVGTAVENELMRSIFSDLHWYGIHLEGTQVTVGPEAAPIWDGSCDALVTEKQEDGSFQRYVVEVKTKSGYGADLLADSCEPSQEYLAQLGLYLKDLSKKGITNEGCLFYVLLSDKNFGTILQISCRYEAESDSIRAYKATSSTGISRSLNYSLTVGDIEARWKKLDKCIADKVQPDGENVYKYPLTQELLEQQSDATLRKMIDGQKVLGDWQIIYSRYKDLHLQTDKVQLGYTEDEISQIRAYYRKLHPKSKL